MENSTAESVWHCVDLLLFPLPPQIRMTIPRNHNSVLIADVGRQIFEALAAVAGGRKTKSEAQGFGKNEFAPWLLGPVM